MRLMARTSGIDYPDDVARFRAILSAAGYDATDADINAAWLAFSDDMCAGWLMPYPEDEINLKMLLANMEPA